MTFLGKVLVAVDDSKPSQYAIDASLRLARSDGASLLFAVVLDPSLRSEVCSFASIRELAERTAEQILGDALDRARGAGISATSRTLFDHPVRGIVKLADSEKAGMILIGTHGRTGISRMLARSIAESVLRETTTPLCIVRRRPVGDRYARLFVPIVDDDLSPLTIAYATRAAQSLGSRLVFCTVDSMPTAKTKAYLESARQHAAQAGVESEWIIVPQEGRLGISILERSRIGECDAIVMATHVRDGLARLVRGEVAETVIRLSEIPVVVLRAHAA